MARSLGKLALVDNMVGQIIVDYLHPQVFEEIEVVVAGNVVHAVEALDDAFAGQFGIKDED